MGTITNSLRMLRDVEGVHGSFVVAMSGSLVDSDLPAVFDSDLLGEVGPRVARLYETFFSGGGDLETCVIRYAEHKLYVRKMTWGIIGVLSSVDINLLGPPHGGEPGHPPHRPRDRKPESDALVRREDGPLARPAAREPAPGGRPDGVRPDGVLAPARSDPGHPRGRPGRRDGLASERHVQMYRGRPVGD